MEKFTISLENFDGPFHLLFHLIEKNKMDIWDIPINTLTEEYLKYIEDYKSKLDSEEKLEEISDFIYIASKLIYIKSKMLLPKKEEEPDPRDEIADKINEYKMFKEISKEFKDISFELYTKEPEKDVFLAINEYQQVTLEEILSEVSLSDLYKAFKDILANQEKKIDTIRSNFKKVNRPTFTIAEKRERILDLIFLHNKICFNEIFEDDSPKIEIVITFLAMLDLIRKGEVLIKQDNNFDTITLEKKEK